MYSGDDIIYPIDQDLLIKKMPTGKSVYYSTKKLREARPDLEYPLASTSGAIQLALNGETEIICHANTGDVLIKEFGFANVGEYLYQKSLVKSAYI